MTDVFKANVRVLAEKTAKKLDAYTVISTRSGRVANYVTKGSKKS